MPQSEIKSSIIEAFHAEMERKRLEAANKANVVVMQSTAQSGGNVSILYFDNALHKMNFELNINSVFFLKQFLDTSRDVSVLPVLNSSDLSVVNTQNTTTENIMPNNDESLNSDVVYYQQLTDSSNPGGLAESMNTGTSNTEQGQ